MSHSGEVTCAHLAKTYKTMRTYAEASVHTDIEASVHTDTDPICVGAISGVTGPRATQQLREILHLQGNNTTISHLREVAVRWGASEGERGVAARR